MKGRFETSPHQHDACLLPVHTSPTVPHDVLDGLAPNVLVTDFDGTMTAVDFFDVILEVVPTQTMPDYWGECVAGRLTHVEALHGIFQHAPRELAVLEKLLPKTQLDPLTADSVRQLKQLGWDVVVVSAGSQWYIDRILSPIANEVRIIANPGEFSPETGLSMTWPPRDTPWYSAHFGVDKAAIIRELQTRGAKRIAFAGDGRPDLAAARIVTEDNRFARSWLADMLDQESLGYRRFEKWSEIATALLKDGITP